MTEQEFENLLGEILRNEQITVQQEHGVRGFLSLEEAETRFREEGLVVLMSDGSRFKVKVEKLEP
jgi:hypothetical protein